MATKKKQNKSDSKGIRREITFSIVYSKKDVVMKEYSQYTKILIGGGAPHGEPGEPAIPWKKYFVSVPENAILDKVIIRQTRTVPFAKNVIIEPCQPNVPTILGTKVTWVPPNPKHYGSDEAWPKVGIQLTGLRQLGGFYMAEIAFCPFRYQPLSKSLKLVERVDLTLIFTIHTKTQPKKEQLPTAWQRAQYYGQRVQGMVLNPKDVIVDRVLREDLIPIPTPLSFPVVDHVIITNLDLAPNFQRLATWRTKLGLRSRVVTVEDIVSGSVLGTSGATFWQTSGYYDGGTRDTAEAIRNFLKWANINWGVKYVLLGGDTEVIPARQALHTAVGRAPYKNLTDSNTNNRLGNSPLSSSVRTGSSAANVMDDDPTTVWECDPTDANPWIRLTMQSHTPINRVDLQWGSTHATGYRIEVSNDATNWITVYTTSNAPGGTEHITFNCTSGRFLRLVITSGTAFALAALSIYGLFNYQYGGNAYNFGSTITRLYLQGPIQMNPSNSAVSDLILIADGVNAGTIVPYNTNASPSNLGWFFIDDIINPQPNPANAPTRFVEIRGPAQFHGNPFVIKTDYNYIATDLYYSDMLSSEYLAGSDHDWDRNRNLVYGEQYGGNLDGVNGLSDVFIGRAPVETQAEADIVIDKIICYEKFLYRDQEGNETVLPQDFAVSVLLGSQNWSTDVVGSLDGSAQGKEDIRDDFLAVDALRWIFTRLYEDWVDVPAADQGPDLAVANNAAILTAIGNGQNIVSLSSHGSPGYLCYLFSTNVDDEFNPPSIWYGHACSTNKFDLAVGEALSEQAMSNINGGAVAYVGNSRFGWTSDNPIERAFWAELFISGEVGRMLAEAHLMGWEWTKYTLNLLGDPAMRVWSDRPIQLSVIHASEVYIPFRTIPPTTHSQTLEVRVFNNGAPVSGALVCLVLGESLFVTGITDSSGLASLQISPTEEGIMSVSVSGKNMIPYEGSVLVKRSMIQCKIPVGCKPSIYCGPRVSCYESLICPKSIGCGQRISCPVEIVCKSQIFCGVDILCPRAIACGPAIICGARIGGCLKLRPEELDIFMQVRDIWGIGNIEEFVRRFDSPEVREAFERLPLELKKSIRMMVEHIRKDVSHS